MKIYNEIVFDAYGKVLYEDSYEYSGDVALCLDVTDLIKYQNERLNAEKRKLEYANDRLSATSSIWGALGFG